MCGGKELISVVIGPRKVVVQHEGNHFQTFQGLAAIESSFCTNAIGEKILLKQLSNPQLDMRPVK